jgi:hypothetical protein
MRSRSARWTPSSISTSSGLSSGRLPAMSKPPIGRFAIAAFSRGSIDMDTRGSVTGFRAASSALLAAALGCACGQPVTTPATPSDPHGALAFFEGTWTTSDSTPVDAFRETCAWLPEGRRHMVCRSRWRTEAGYREGMSAFSYEPSAAEYRYHGFRSGAAVATRKGQRRANGWRFTSDRGAGDDRVQTRVTIEKTAEGRFRFLSASAKRGQPVASECTGRIRACRPMRRPGTGA